MKRHVQLEGVRKWAGDHLLELEGQPLEVLDRFFGQYGSYVLAGCEVTPAADEIAAADGLVDVAPGLVVLAGVDAGGADVVMVVPFEGVAGVPLPIYLTLAWNTRLGEYVTGGEKPIAYDYYASASTVEPAEGTAYLLFDADTPRFVDVIQDANHSFITEAEREKWNGLLPVLTEYVDERFESFDPTAVGELRSFAKGQPFENDDYLLCDGSIIDPADYPELEMVDTPVSDIIDAGFTSRIYELSGADGIWVAAGLMTGGSPLIRTSTDLVNWTNRVTPGISIRQSLVPVRYIDGYFLVGLGNRLYYSQDGVTWSYTIPSISTNNENRDSVLNVIKVGDTWVVAVLHGVYISKDLTSWTSIGGTGYVAGMASGNGRTIIFTNGDSSPKYYYSDDLASWTEVSLPLTTNEVLRGIAYGNGKWIFTTSIGNLFMSTDGATTWTKQQSIFGKVDIKQIAVSGQNWLIGSLANGAAVSSDNAEHWYIIPSELSSGNRNNVNTDGNDDFFVIAGNNSVSYATSIGTLATRVRMRKFLQFDSGNPYTKTYIRVKK